MLSKQEVFDVRSTESLELSQTSEGESMVSQSL